MLYDSLNASLFTRSGEFFFLHSPSEYARQSLSARQVIQPQCLVEVAPGSRPPLQLVSKSSGDRGYASHSGYSTVTFVLIVLSLRLTVGVSTLCISIYSTLCVSIYSTLCVTVCSTLPQLAQIDLSCVDVPLNTKQTNKLAHCLSVFVSTLCISICDLCVNCNTLN